MKKPNKKSTKMTRHTDKQITQLKSTSKTDYKKLKKETDEIVGRVNGEYATVNWTPIWYY